LRGEGKERKVFLTGKLVRPKAEVVEEGVLLGVVGRSNLEKVHTKGKGKEKKTNWDRVGEIKENALTSNIPKQKQRSGHRYN